MPVDLREIASISGMSGLFRIISPTRNGVVVETLAETPVRSVAQAKHRLSLLNEISIYTNDPEVTAPLAEIFDTIHKKHGQNIPVNAKSSNPELIGFMEAILPDFDRERVYVSDIKKLANWYGIVSKFLTFQAAPETKAPKAKASQEATSEAETKPAEKKTKPKAEKAEKPAKEAKEESAEAKPKAAAKKPKKSAE